MTTKISKPHGIKTLKTTTLRSSLSPASKSTPSTLVRLPPEIRNQIYGYLTNEPKDPLNLWCAHELLPRTQVALNSTPLSRNCCLAMTCRQLRIEFYPLYWNIEKVAISLGDVRAFLDTFLLSSSSTTFNIKIVEVTVLDQHCIRYKHWGINQILSAKTRFPHIKWRIVRILRDVFGCAFRSRAQREEYYIKERFHECHSSIENNDPITGMFNNIITTADERLWWAVQARLLSSVVLYRVQIFLPANPPTPQSDSRPNSVWYCQVRCTLSKKSGKLDKEDTELILYLCKLVGLEEMQKKYKAHRNELLAVVTVKGVEAFVGETWVLRFDEWKLCNAAYEVY